MKFITPRIYSTLFSPDGGEGGGGAAADTNAITLNDSAFDRLGLPKEMRKMELSNGPTPTLSAPGDKAKASPKPPGKQGATSGDQTKEAGKAGEEGEQAGGEGGSTLTEEEQAAQAAEAEQTRLEAKAAELGISVDDVKAQEAEEAGAGDEAGAVQDAPEMSDEAAQYVHALVAEHEQALTAVKSEAEQAKAKAAELESQLAQAKRPAAQVMNIPPILLANDEQAIRQQDAEYAAFEKWALANWDGSAEVPARGDQPGQPAYSAEQIRGRYAEIKELRSKIVPLAAQKLQERRAQDATAKTVYPMLFKSDSPQAKIVDGMLANYPELQVVLPNFRMIAGDSLVGEKIRTTLADPTNKAHAATMQFLNAFPELKAMITLPSAKTAAGAKAGAVNLGAAGQRRLPPLKGKPGAAMGKAPRSGGGGTSTRATGKTGDVSSKQLSQLQKGGLSERDALTQMIRGANIPTLAPKANNTSQ